MLARLQEDHKRLIGLADRLEGELCEACPADLSDLAQVRWALARELLMHLAIEEQMLRGEPGRAPADSAPSRLRDHLRDHLSHWSGDAIVRGWADYRVATVKLLSALRRRIADEERTFSPARGWA